MYGKYFSSTFTGSMVGAGAHVFAVWGYVIANCRNGSIELNPKLLAMILGEDEEPIQAAIDFLCSPDPNSRSKNNDGCRLVKTGPFLFDVPNHASYRKILNEDERRAYFRDKKREQRQKAKALTVGQVGQSKTVQDMSTVSTQSEADTESKEEKKARKARCTLSELKEYCVSLGLPESDGEACFNKWEGNGWTNGGKAIKDCKATIRSWKDQGYLPSQKHGVNGTRSVQVQL